MTDYSQYINDYLSGDLSADKTRELKARLAIDKELQDEFHIISSSSEYLKARTTLDEIEGDSLLEEADRLVLEHFSALGEDQDLSVSEEVLGDICDLPEVNKVRVGLTFWRRKVLIPVLATAAVLSGIVLIIRSAPFADPNTALYSKYYKPLSADIFELEDVRGGNGQSFYLGKTCYLEKDYTCAIRYFGSSIGLQFYLGLAHIGTENYEDALAVLSDFQMNYPFHPGANWYLGLLYIRLNGLDMAKTYLENLMSMENIYKQDAQNLIRKINKLKAAEAN